LCEDQFGNEDYSIMSKKFAPLLVVALSVLTSSLKSDSNGYADAPATLLRGRPQQLAEESASPLEVIPKEGDGLPPMPSLDADDATLERFASEPDVASDSQSRNVAVELADTSVRPPQHQVVVIKRKIFQHASVQQQQPRVQTAPRSPESIQLVQKPSPKLQNPSNSEEASSSTNTKEGQSGFSPSSVFKPEQDTGANDDDEDDPDLGDGQVAFSVASADQDQEGAGFTRPGAGSGKADIVYFGVFGKTFYGASMKKNLFFLDNVIALKWTDQRVTALIPAGNEKLTLSWKQALSSIWMPEVVITNRAIKKVEIISTTVTIYTSGMVTKVERALVGCNNIYELSEYPFDTQKLRMKLASSKYMLNDVALEPSTDGSLTGVKDDLFKAFPYTLKDHRIYAFEEVDGALKKSRGVFEMTVERQLSKYEESHLMPACLFIIISWGVFWFPFETPFITPRLALSILALLSFTNLVITSGKAIPPGAPMNWNDVFNFNVQALMMCTILLNILSEIYFHHFRVEDVARAVNNEAKIVQPVLSTVVLTITLTGGMYKWISIPVASWVCKILILVAMLTYVFHRQSTAVSAKAAKEAKAAEAKAAA